MTKCDGNLLQVAQEMRKGLCRRFLEREHPDEVSSEPQMVSVTVERRVSGLETHELVQRAVRRRPSRGSSSGAA